MKTFAFALGSLAILLAGCARPKPTTVQIDPALSILIPPDTNLLVAVNVEALRKTPLYEKYLAGANFPRIEELGKYTGIDPRKDVWQLLFLSDGKHAVVLSRGNFASEMESKLERGGAKVIPHKMYHIVGQEEAAVVFFNSTTAAVGSVESLRSLLDARDKTKGPPAAIAARMKEIPAEVQLWAVSIGALRGPTLRGNLANLNNLGAMMDWASLHLDFREGLKGLVRASGTSPENAKQLHDSLRGMMGLGRMMAPADQPDLLHVFDGLQVTQDSNVVSLKIEEPPELMEKVASHYLR